MSELNKYLQNSWQLIDAGIKINTIDGSGTTELLSNRIFIDEPVANAINEIDIPKEPILTYLVNSIRFREKETPYSFVTAASMPILPTKFEGR